ncbi:GAF domain-containing protein [Tuberibacillus sp. Marseille-P3662]|uniref:GAF domain-containing protein n=1 Tax=Tuberibacillus sp. Marseille-P3662 TaxID=1965358 RepID=UPI000A1CA6FF|nr:GAF domain-containing protein [Tuberibacillus sp. Marseille-P3662]
MFNVSSYQGASENNWQLALKQLDALLEGESNITANLANASALLNQFLDEINWVGFYVHDGSELVLGPFQGLPACVRIPIGKGVCGTAAQQQTTVRVHDVNVFEGHIACDANSQSEIVVPIIKNGEVFGVLDIDAPIIGRFSETDQINLESFVDVLLKHI